jgi:toxin HigB-1
VSQNNTAKELSEASSSSMRCLKSSSLTIPKRMTFIDACRATSYDSSMIQSIRHKGLEQFFSGGNAAGIHPHHVKRLRLQLVILDTAQTLNDIDVPGFKLHPLKGDQSGRWSIKVSGNWRLTFEYRVGDVYLLDYEDYH